LTIFFFSLGDVREKGYRLQGIQLPKSMAL
jgi:hypothetical protein